MLLSDIVFKLAAVSIFFEFGGCGLLLISFHGVERKQFVLRNDCDFVSDELNEVF